MSTFSGAAALQLCVRGLDKVTAWRFYKPPRVAAAAALQTRPTFQDDEVT